MTHELINKIATINCSDEERKEIYEACVKQIPQRPLMKQIEDGKAKECCIESCPTCKTVVSYEWCTNCGQQILWEDEE